MNIKMKLALLITFISIVAIMGVTYAVRFRYRQYDNTLMEVVIWPSGGSRRGAPIHRFVVTNDGTLISYYASDLSDSGYARRHNALRFIRERELTTLSEEDMLRISELVDRIVTGLLPGDSMAITHFHALFLRNGIIYENTSMMSVPLFDLIVLLEELTPISVRWPWQSRKSGGQQDVTKPQSDFAISSFRIPEMIDRFGNRALDNIRAGME